MVVGEVERDALLHWNIQEVKLYQLRISYSWQRLVHTTKTLKASQS